MKKFINSIVFVLLNLLLFSCEIGLGAAVDTEPPSLTIDQPGADYIIRDEFMISGTWGDDGDIASFNVTLQRTNNDDIVYGPFEVSYVEVEKENPGAKNTWSCVINPTNRSLNAYNNSFNSEYSEAYASQRYEINAIDGSYVATVSVTDGAEHTTTKTIQFAIDNTAPVVVIQRPATKAQDDSPDSYGKLFTLEGQAADDSDVSLVRVNIFSDSACTQLVHYVDLTNVPPTISLDVAEFIEGDASTNYSKIYGSAEKDGTKQFYCSLEAYDSAKRYPIGKNQSAEDLKGNVTTSYYLYNDIATSILSEHKITEVYHMLNGVYTLNDASRNLQTINSVESLLASNVVNNGYFSLNPANNPTFSVSGHSVLNGNGKDFDSQEHSISNGSSIVIEVATGLDAIPLIKDSLKPYFIECEADGTVKNGASPIYPTADKPAQSGTSYKFVTPLSTADGLKIGCNYLLGIEGTDQKNNTIVPAGSGKGYGFHLSSSGKAPIVELSSPTKSISYIKSGDILPIAGTVSVEEGIPLVTIVQGSTELWRSDFKDSDATIVNDNKQFAFSFVPAFSGGSSQNVFSITALLEGQKTPNSITVMYDEDAPGILLLKQEPLANKYDDNGNKVSYIDDSGAANYNYLNKDFSFTASVTDDFDTVASTKWELIQDNVTKLSGSFTNPTNQTVTVDTTQLDDVKNVTLRITALDRAGNTKIENYYYRVDQDTDKPVIRLDNAGNVNFAVKTWAALKATKDAGTPKNVLVNGEPLPLEIIDDDAVTKVIVHKGEFTKNGSDYTAPATPLTDETKVEGLNRQSYPYSYTLPAVSGVYLFEIEAFDKYNISSGIKQIVIQTTPVAPEVTYELDKNWIKAGSGEKFNVTIKIASEQAPFKITKRNSSGTFDDITSTLNKISDTEYKHENIDIASTETFVYRVSDVNNHDSELVNVQLGVDSKVDDLTIKLNDFTKESTKNAGFNFAGTAEDKDSGLEKVKFKISGTKNGASVNKEVDATGTSDWFYYLTYSSWSEVFAEEGNKTITVTALDKVGNEKTVTHNFVYDKENPKLSIDDSSIRTFIPSSGFNITGTASDSYSFDSLVIKEYFKSTAAGSYAETTESAAGVTATVNADHSWSQHIPFGTLNNGFYEYEFIAKDTVGNIVTDKKTDIQVDQQAPEATVANPSEYTKLNSYTFEGTAYDQNLSRVTVYLQKKTGGVWADVTGQNSEVTPNSLNDPLKPKGWEWKVYDLTDGEYRVRVEATDKAGNSVGVAANGQSEVTSSQALTVDLTAPVSVINASGLVKDDGTSVAAGTDLSAQSETKFYAKESASPGTTAPFTISGVITEANYDNSKVTLTAKKDDVTTTAPTLTFAADTKQWSFAPILAADGTKDGTYKYTITIRDKAENRTDYVVNVCYDSLKPSVSITSPVDGEIINSSSITAQGSVRDTGIGLRKLEYSKDGGTTWSAEDTITVSSNASSWTKTWTGLQEGAINLKMRATDLLGHTQESEAVRFSYDQNPPALTFTQLANYYTSGNITLTGTAYDTNLLKSVKISDEYTANQNTTTNNYATDITAGSIVSAKSDSTKLTWSKTILIGSLGNGTHKFTAIAEDDAGRTSTVTWTTTVDTTKPSMTLEALPSRTDTQANSFTFRGTALDATSGVDKVELTVTAADGKKRTVKATGKENWYYSVTFADDTAAASETGASGNTWKEVFAAEGTKTVTIKVYDKAGLNETNFTYAEEASASANKTFIYDKENPQFSITGTSVLEYMPETGFTVTGNAGDSYKLYGSPEGTGSIVVTEYHKGTAGGAVFTETDASKNSAKNTFNVTSVTNGTGSISIPLPLNLAGLPNGKPADGTYKYTFTLKDSVGNITTYNINQVIVDTTAPVITVTTPNSDTAKTGINAINETNFRFEGSVTEANGVAGVYYKIIPSTGSVPAKPAGNKNLADTWTSDGWIAATSGTSSWSANQAFISGKTSNASAFCEGIGYKIYVYAVDKAGNVNASAVTRSFDVDLTYPSVVTRTGNADGSSKTVLDTSTTITKTSAYTFDFSVADTFDLDAAEPYTLTLKKDDADLGKTAVTDAPYYSVGALNGGYYPVTITVPAGVKGDGLYEYTVTAKDKAGKTTSVTRNIRLDTKAPELFILSPDLSGYQNSEKVTVKGSAEDDSGTFAVWYVYGVDSEPEVPSTLTKVDNSWTTKSWNKATGTTSWTISDLTGTEGTGKKLFVRAVDKNGLVSDVQSGTINIDLSNPDSSTDETALIKNSDFSFTGTAWDNNGIKSVTIVQSGEASATYSTDSDEEAAPSITVTGGVSKLAQAKSLATKAAWTKNFAVSSLADGNYNYSIKVKDMAGKETVKSRSVTVDKTPPSIGTPTLTWTDSPAAGVAHTVKTATLSVIPTDTNLDSVYYFINDGSNTTITGYATVPSTSWESIISSEKLIGGENTTVYEKAISFADGDGTVYIKVTDKAGNTSYNTVLTYSVDTTKPEKPVLNTVDGETLSETKMINGTAAVEFKLTAKDQNDHYSGGTKIGLDATKVSSVNLSKIGTNVITPNAAANGKGTATLSGGVKTGEWTVSIPVSAFTGLTAGVTPVYVKVSDISGNVEEYEIFSIELDNVKPVPSITSPYPSETATPSLINGTMDVTGSVTEIYPKSVGLYYRTAAPSSADSSDTTISGWVKIDEFIKGVNGATVSDINKFTFEDVDFNTLSGASAETLKKHDIWLLVYAEDTAGNKSVINAKQFTVDMDTDRPEVKFNNISLGAVMASDSRVGFENSELYGSITDDDGVPETVQYYIGASAPAAGGAGWISPASNSNFTYSNGSFTLKFLNAEGKPADGEKNIFFKIVDKAGNTFISTASLTYDTSSVRITDGTNIYGSRPAAGTTTTPSAVYLKVDTQSPDVFAEGYYLGDTPSSDDAGWSTAITAATFGGTQNKFSLRQYAYDANGVISVVTHIPVDSEDNSVTGYSNTLADTNPAVKGYYEYIFTKQAGANSTIESNGITYTKWISSVINVTGMKSGTRQCEIIVSDGIKSKTTPVNISIDNDAPVVVVESQNANEQMRSAFLMKGQFTDGDQGTQLWYNLSATTTPGAWSASPVSATTAMNWRIAFDGDQNPQDVYTHDGVPKEIIASLYDTVIIASSGVNSGKAVWKETGAGHSAGDLYTPITTVYFHFKVQDRLGNESLSYIPLKLDPQGDIPVITLVSPDSTQTTLGGTIRFSGSAEDDATIAALYIEVDPQYNAASGFIPWSSTHKTPSYTKDGTPVSAKTPEQVLTAENYPNNPYELINSKVTPGKQKATTVKAVYIGNGLSWNIALNKYGEWDNKEAGINQVAVRFYAVDVDGNMSQPTEPFIFDVDCDKPKIGNSQKFYLKKYSDNAAGTGTVDASVEYTDGMWLKGEWWLEGSVEDESGITTVTMNNASIKESSTAVSKGNGVNQWPNTSGYVTHYKVGNSTADRAGKLEYTLSITDGDTKTNEKVFSINYDNKAPALAATTDENYSISTIVKNSNGFYTVRSAVTEGSDESGFDKVVFYFKRITAGYQNVYDSYMAKTYTDGAGQKVNTSNQFAYAGLVYQDYLYWKTATLAANGVNGSSITITAKDENIHAGGLVKVDGTIYTIKYIDDTQTILTLNGNPSETASGTIYYAIGHVVDHAGAESGGTNAGKISTVNAVNKGYAYGYYGNSPDDDGDKMIETVSTSGTRTIWSGSINSNNIPDGPIEIHYVAFDKAGNIAHGVVESASVANNAPRLAGVTVWTDYNGNGKGWRNSGDHASDYDSETKSKYYSKVRPQIGGKLTDRSNDVTGRLVVSSNDLGIGETNARNEKGSAYMKVTDTVKFIPEIVGGNGQLYYDYKIGKASSFTYDADYNITGFTESAAAGSKAKKGGAWTNDATKLPLKNDSNANVFGYDEGDDYPKSTDPNTTLTYVDGHTDGVITFDAANFLSQLDNTTSEDPTWFDVRIWDSTEGGTPYTNTLSCEMQIALMNKYNDENRPFAWIRPFYWKNKTENSVVWGNNSEGTLEAQGHIELEEDLTAGITGLISGNNPKVSGRIKLEGYAYDDIKLKELYVQFADHSVLGTATKVADYSGVWTTTTHSTSDGWDFVAEDIFCNAEGHLVKWTLEVDTAKRSAAAQLARAFVVYAVDARGSAATNTSVHSGTTQTAKSASALWGSKKSEADAYTKYYTDETCKTLVTSETKDTDIVYSANNMTYYYEVDIVPYIVKIKTEMANLQRKESKWSTTSRTANGHYPVRVTVKDLEGGTTRSGETITFYGFNLDGAKYGAQSLGAAADSGAYNGRTLDVTNIASSSEVQLTVNNIPTLNNVNGNDSTGTGVQTEITDVSKKYKASTYENYYNRQPNGDNNNILTDDVHFDIWEINSAAAIPISGKIEQPVMKIRPTDGKIGFAFVNGPLYFSMGGSQDSEDFSYKYWIASYDFFTSVGFTYDSLGNSYGVAAGGDINTTNSDAFIFMSSKFGRGNYDQDGSYNGTNTLRLEKIAQTQANGIVDFDKQRIKSPSLKTSPGSSSGTNVYLAYFDALNNEIRFKAGNTATGNKPGKSWVRKIIRMDTPGSGYAGAWVNYDGDGGTIKGKLKTGYYVYFCDSDGNKIDNTPYVLDAIWEPEDQGGQGAFILRPELGQTEFKPFIAPLIANRTVGANGEKYAFRQDGDFRILEEDIYIRIEEAHPIPPAGNKPFGQFKDSATARLPTYTTANVSIIASDSKTYGGGNYVSLAVVPAAVANNNGNDRVVAVWYDQAKDSNNPVLRYAYNNDPVNHPETWTYVNSVFDQNSDMAKAGEYCKVEVDSYGGVHIAAYDPTNLDLCYAYLPASLKGAAANSASFRTCIVDSNGVVGSNLSLDVGRISAAGNVIPYIGYYSTSSIKPKQAYYVGGFASNAASIANGAVDDEYTGAWECTLVPTSSTIEMQSNQHNDINIGLWKDDGVIIDSTSGKYNTGISSYYNSPGGYQSNSYGQVYGNGTRNAVLGYAVKHGASSDNIETAQMK